MVLPPFAVFMYDIDQDENLIKKSKEIMNRIRKESYLNTNEFVEERPKKKIRIDVEQRTNHKLDPYKEVENVRIRNLNQEDVFSGRYLKQDKENFILADDDSKQRRNSDRKEGLRLRKACIPFSSDEDRYIREGLENIGKKWTQILKNYPFCSTRNRATLQKRAKGLNLV